MKMLIQKVLEVSVIVDIFCVVGFYGSLEVGVLDLKQANIYCSLAIIYIGVASITIMCLGQAERRDKL